MKIKIAALISVLIVTTPLSAQEIIKGPNGGRLVKGEAYNVELVINDVIATVYVSDLKSRPIPAKGVQAHVTLTVDDQEQRIVLEAQQNNRLSGKSSVPLPTNGRGVVRLTTSNGKTLEVRFHASRDFDHQPQHK